MSTSHAAPSKHRWRFFRAGGLDQVRLENAADFRHLELLDQKLWVSLSCPVKGLEFDEKTLTLIDTDHDGRVRAPEIINAVQWAEDHLKDLGQLKDGTDVLPLDQINDQTESGRIILAAARQILKNLGKPEAVSISLADLGDRTRIFAQTKFNGDGIVPADCTDDPFLQAVITDMLNTIGGETDRSGKPGIDQARVDAFFNQLSAYTLWAAKAESDASTIMPLGQDTAAAVQALLAVGSRVDDYFARCRLAAYDARALPAVNRKEDEYLAVGLKDMTLDARELSAFPLARIEPGKALSLTEGLNPAWSDAIERLRQRVVAPLLDPKQTSLTAGEWALLTGKLAPHQAWISSKPATAIEKLGLPRMREILASSAKDALTQLIAQDKALEREAGAIEQVEKLVRYYRDLHRLLNNFVNFSDFYSTDRLAVFQAGTLYLDARACELCVRVDDAGKHAALGGMAKTYLAYCDCTRPSGEKMTIAAAFTDGDSDNLLVGRNGLFYDRKGRDWDATIVKVIENPISIRQAFWSPYKKLVRLVEEQIAKRAAAADAGMDAKLAAAASATANVDKLKPAGPKKIDVGTVAALGVAFGALGTAFATVAGYAVGVLRLPFWQVCLAVAGLLMLISGPAMLVAWLKLRQRNLGPILDACGWAVNGRVKINVSFGRSLTSVAQLPSGAQQALDDPFGESPSLWPKLLGLILAIAFILSFLNSFGLIHQWSDGKWGDPKQRQAVNFTDLIKGIGAETNAPPK
jgi:hypothetical protein